MRRFFSAAPLWTPVALGAVITVAVWTVIFGPGEHGSWLRAAVFGCLVAGPMTAYDWREGRRQRRAAQSATGPLTPDERDAVHRAADKGVLPADPRLHPATLRLAHHELGVAEKDRTGMIVVLSVLLGLSALIAVTDHSRWYAFFACIFAATLGSTVVDVPRRRRRVARLDQAAGPTSPSALF